MSVRQPKITVYAPCFNEEKILPFFLKHYSAFCQKIIIYDNQSSDRSVEIAKSCPIVEVREFFTGGKFSERALTDLRNSAWKGNTSDYVIVCDMDEFLYVKDFDRFFASAWDFDVYKPVGFEMYSRTFPADQTLPLTQQVKRGWFSPSYSKMVLFRPDRVSQMNFGPGSHKASPVGMDEIRVYDSQNFGAQLKLLHYKSLGQDWLLSRNAVLAARSSDGNKARGWGTHYSLPESFHKRKRFLMRFLSFNCVDHNRHPMFAVSKFVQGQRKKGKNKPSL